MSSLSFPVSERKPALSVRIVVCDHYSTKPIPGVDVIYSEFRGSDIKQVPVLRIFGPAPDGHKVCLHVHGVFPYFYVPCPVSNPEPQFLYQMAASLDKALNIAMKQATSANQHVYKITLVKGLPFYGFHDKEHLFLKVFLYNPGLIKQAVDLCSNGAILGQTFQPHESHLNFTLQFFIDFNLFGMSNVDLQTVSYRKKSSVSQNSNDPLESPDEVTIKPESMCFYEADCAASHIINRQRVGKGDGIENPGLEEVWHQEKERRKLLNMSLASKSLSQDRIKLEESDTHYKFEQIFHMKISNVINKPVDVLSENSLEASVNYPAESMEGSQLLNAVDVSVHLPENTFCCSFNETLKDLTNELPEEANDTLVDENIALNSSLSQHYSQVQLNSEDLDLVDMLKDLEEKETEDDSVMNTPAVLDRVDEDVDAEYSQIFNEETVLLDGKEDGEESVEDSPTWNDSFWNGVNIPQLDGTCDDDHVKKVRKRKMRAFKLGLSRPKVRNKNTALIKLNPESELNIKPEQISESDIMSETMTKQNIKTEQLTELNIKSELDNSVPDEIDVSRETIDSISELHCKKGSSIASKSSFKESQQILKCDTPITDLVIKCETESKSEKLEASFCYDENKRYIPVAGPSMCNKFKTEKKLPDALYDEDIYTSDSCNTSQENDDLGFISFYNQSKLFDNTFDDGNKSENVYSTNQQDQLTRMQQDDTSDEDIKLHFSVTPLVSTKIKADDNEMMRSVILTPKFRPPSNKYIVSTMEKYNISKVNHLKPYFSNHKDVGDKIEIGHMVIKLQSESVHDQKPFENVLNVTSIEEWRQLLFLQNNDLSNDTTKCENLKSLLAGNRQCILEPIKKPPSYNEVLRWLANNKNEMVKSKDINESSYNNEVSRNNDELDNSQVIGLNELESNISLEDEHKNSDIENCQISMHTDGSFLCFGSAPSEKELPVAPTVELNYLTTMVLEVHSNNRGDLNPDPVVDSIKAAFLTITNDCPKGHKLPKTVTEIFVVDEMMSPKILDRCVFDAAVTYVNNENELFENVLLFIKKHDPDIMCGYEIEMNSWGYFLERSQVLGLDIVTEISRITEKHRQKRWKHDENNFEGRIIGRVMFNVWRLFRHELALSSYSFENCMFEILTERVPRYSYSQLSEWWNDESRILRWISVEHYLTRLSGTVRMMEKLDIINRTAELARLFGLQWWEVLSRGSQFRVESLMLRAARPLNLVAMSPTVKQRAAMRAPECLPLIFEPESRFYSDPVIVLDFQSLYPSMMIAYNYCFSTCIGRVQNMSGETAYEFGAWRLRIPKSKLETLVKNQLVHWSPVGVGFVKPSVRRGVLPALLRRILAARQAVKKNMKQQTDESLKKAMHSRQLGLKLIANVTYGYTAANFSGRMPCVEVGDSVVAKGRETLERAIKLVQNNKRWNVKVVYGDTDSMFVQVPGGTRREAFLIGQQIADAVTADNPSPVALKLEKVYQPCILQTKKRYVGFMYESAEQDSPVFEAKGIETVRRDGCPAGVKLLQRALCSLFTDGDVSNVKRDVTATLARLASGALSPRELFLTREYRGPTVTAAAPPTEIARRLFSRDRRALPRTGERVAWLVCAGAPGLPLIKLAKSPEELRKDPSLQPHITYYATRVLLPPLHRCLSLLGVNVFKWWSELGYGREAQSTAPTSGGIARYMWRERCALCGVRAQRSLCSGCTSQPQRSVAAVWARLSAASTHLHYCRTICRSCSGHRDSIQCENTECPVLWRTATAQQKLTQIQDIIREMPSELKCCESLQF